MILRALYEREREAAREKAMAEVPAIYNRCPVCGRLVRPLFSDLRDLDMCVACAGRLQVRGDIVAENAIPQEPPAEEENPEVM